MMCPYRELLLWRQAYELTYHIYATTRCFPPEDPGDLAARLRSAAIDLPVHIAESYACEGTRFARGLRRARRDLLILEHLVAIANRLAYWPLPQAGRVTCRLNELHRHIRAFLRCLTP